MSDDLIDMDLGHILIIHVSLSSPLYLFCSLCFSCLFSSSRYTPHGTVDLTAIARTSGAVSHSPILPTSELPGMTNGSSLLGTSPINNNNNGKTSFSHVSCVTFFLCRQAFLEWGLDSQLGDADTLLLCIFSLRAPFRVCLDGLNCGQCRPAY